jgi:hypothetical protein
MDDLFKFVILIFVLVGIGSLGAMSFQYCNDSDNRLLIQKCIEKGNKPEDCKALVVDDGNHR